MHFFRRKKCIELFWFYFSKLRVRSCEPCEPLYAPVNVNNESFVIVREIKTKIFYHTNDCDGYEILLKS